MGCRLAGLGVVVTTGGQSKSIFFTVVLFFGAVAAPRVKETLEKNGTPLRKRDSKAAEPAPSHLVRIPDHAHHFSLNAPRTIAMHRPTADSSPYLR